MFKKILMISIFGIASISNYISADNKQLAINGARSYAKAHKEMATNIIAAVKSDYANNSLMNAIVDRNIANVESSLKNIKDINEQHPFWIKFSGFGGVSSNGELQEKMFTGQTYLSLALLNSVFDSTEEEKNKSLSIIQMLLKAKAANIILTHSFFLKQTDGVVRDFVAELSIFSWAIFAGCSERVLKSLFDSGFVDEDLCACDTYREFAELIGSSAVVNLLDDYCKKISSKKSNARNAQRGHRAKRHAKRNHRRRPQRSPRRNCIGCSR